MRMIAINYINFEKHKKLVILCFIKIYLTFNEILFNFFYLKENSKPSNQFEKSFIFNSNNFF
jgi:hypothetical protein